MEIDAGHVGLVVGSKAHKTFWPEATRWLALEPIRRSKPRRRSPASRERSSCDGSESDAWAFEFRASAATFRRRRVTNHELAARIDTSHDWIVAKTGILERRVAARRRGAQRHG